MQLYLQSVVEYVSKLLFLEHLDSWVYQLRRPNEVLVLRRSELVLVPCFKFPRNGEVLVVEDAHLAVGVVAPSVDSPAWS